ncbi:MAG: flagellar basal body-associated FliL family protein [Pseudomonadota bacterium]
MSKPAAKPAAPAAATDAAPPPKSKKMLIIIIAVLVLVIAGGAGWYFTKGHAPEAGHVEEAKHEPPAEPKFIPLGEKFTVNLQREEGDQYLQAGITLKVLDPKLEEKIKATMPELRSKLLFLLASKKPSELVTAEGKKYLVEQIIAEADGILGVIAAPAHAPVAVAPVAPAAPVAHAEPAAHGETHAPAQAAVAAPVAVASAPAVPKTTGVVDVLFSDFIIQ